MFGRLTNMLKRAEMATDMMVLEKSPDSPRAAKIRAKYEMQRFDDAIRAEIKEEVERVVAKVKSEREKS